MDLVKLNGLWTKVYLENQTYSFKRMHSSFWQINQLHNQDPGSFLIWEHSFFHSKIILSSSLLLWLKKLKCDAERPSISARKSSRNSIMDIKWNTIWYLIIKLWFWNRMKLHIKWTRYNSIIFISCFFQQQTLRNDY